MTIAASGQGRWREELDYPLDCKKSGLTPVLVVLDSTPNPKLAELTRAFTDQDGEVYVGESAWQHLDQLAGPTMALFLERYIRAPMDHLISEEPEQIPEIRARIDGNTLVVTLDQEEMFILREGFSLEDELGDSMPDDLFDGDI